VIDILGVGDIGARVKKMMKLYLLWKNMKKERPNKILLIKIMF
jgi:hypothetical protein